MPFEVRFYEQPENFCLAEADHCAAQKSKIQRLVHDTFVWCIRRFYLYINILNKEENI